MSDKKTPTATPATARPKARKPKRPGRSDFYRLRFKAELADKARAAELCGVTVRTIENWDAKGAPPMAMRLLSLYDRKDCGGVGPDWRGWVFSREVLTNARLKLRFTPEGLGRHKAHMQALTRAEGEINRLRSACPAMRALRAAARRWRWAARLTKATERAAARLARRFPAG